MSDFAMQFALGERVGRRLVRAALDRLGLEANSPDELRRLVVCAVDTSGIQIIADAIEETARSPRFEEITPLLLGLHRPSDRTCLGELLPAWALVRAAALLWECRSARPLGSVSGMPDGVAEHYAAKIALWLQSDKARHGVPIRSSGEVASA